MSTLNRINSNSVAVQTFLGAQKVSPGLEIHCSLEHGKNKTTVAGEEHHRVEERQASNDECKASITTIEQSFPEVTDNSTLHNDVKTTSRRRKVALQVQVRALLETHSSIEEFVAEADTLFASCTKESEWQTVDVKSARWKSFLKRVADLNQRELIEDARQRLYLSRKRTVLYGGFDLSSIPEQVELIRARNRSGFKGVTKSLWEHMTRKKMLPWCMLELLVT